MKPLTDCEPRGVSTPVASVLLVALTVILAGVVAAGLGTWSPDSTGPTAAFELSVDGETGEVTLEHVAGDPVDVGELSLTVEVDGEPLAHQPPVPFVGADGYDGSPRGPFNAATDSEWTVGERAGFRVAGTNTPTIEPGREVTVTLVVEGQTIAKLEETA